MKKDILINDGVHVQAVMAMKRKQLKKQKARVSPSPIGKPLPRTAAAVQGGQATLSQTDSRISVFYVVLALQECKTQERVDEESLTLMFQKVPEKL